MSQQPQLTIEESFVEGRSCSICGQPTLAVAKLEKLPDYVRCSTCGSAFVIEEGGVRVMYGSIPAEYPETRDFALKQWASLEAIEALAEAERAVPAALPESPSPTEAEFEIQERDQIDLEAEHKELAPAAESIEAEIPAEADDLAPELSLAAEGADLHAAPFIEAEIEQALQAEPTATEPPGSQAQEPAPGRRFRVRYTGPRAMFPDVACAHCTRSPAERNLIVMGQMATPGGDIARQAFTLPLCDVCYARARARSDEAASARQQAHLISALIAVVLVVAALVLGLTDFQERPLVSAALLGLLALIGYGFPALILIGRAGRMPPSQDALFVRSTLMVAPQPMEGETWFDWRSAGYAELFKQASGASALGETSEVEDAFFPSQVAEPPPAAPSTEE